MRINVMEKQFQFESEQQRLSQFWLENAIYTTEHNPGPLYSIDTPPPTVSGSLHIGHIFSYTQTDIIARYKRMSGFSVFYPFGFDDNGLPTERFVEKKLGISPFVVGRSEFIKQCLGVTHEVEEQFKQLWQQIGLSADWRECYSTISAQSRQISQASFIDLYHKGFVYRAYEPALYCTACRTSVAQAELDDAQKPSTFNDIVFESSDGTPLTISTTRPELLPACVALLYHPEDIRYKHLQGTHARVPLFDTIVPIIPDLEVLPEKGTGLVMCCTFGDKQDIVWFKRHKLPYRNIIGFDGKWTEAAGILAGLKLAQARQMVLDELAKQQKLVGQRAIEHTVNIHERCKKEIEYIALAQWFLKILPYKQQLIDLADTIQWSPAFMKARYKNWVENLTWDWCLSRQRYFGIPFPAWHCNDCHHIILANTQDLPLDPQEIPFTGQCPQCKGSSISPDNDVMDTWNTSSLTPQICAALYNKNAQHIFDEPTPRSFLPMSMRPQAHDIIRTWAFYTIIKSWMHNSTIPWHDIVISGHVLSDSAEKLSKSKNNAKLAPEELLKTYPADVIRYWTASATLGQDSAFSDTQLKIGHRLVTKLWNAFRFFHEHAIRKTEQPSKLDTVNEWILHQLTATFNSYKLSFDAYEFNGALEAIDRFFWHDFCDNYLELIKEQLFKPELYSLEMVEATRWTLYTVGVHILQLYAPFIPYVTESLYQQLFKEDEKTLSLHQMRFKPFLWYFAESAQIMQHFNNVVAQIRKLKTQEQLSLKTPLEVLVIYHEKQEILDAIRTLQQYIKGISHAGTIEYCVGASKESTISQIAGNWHITVGL